MSLKMWDRDYIPDGVGGFQQADSTEELRQNALFLLAAHRGGFPLLPELGSKLYTLYREKPSARKELAMAYAQEALEPLGLTVTGVRLSGQDPITLELQLVYNGDNMNLEVKVN